MKNRKTIFTIIFALVLALSIVTVSAAAISTNETKPGKPATKPDASVCETSGDCGVQPLKGFVEGLPSLTLEERATLLADLAEIERYENQINEIYSRMTDENAEQLYAEIDAVDEKLTAVLERNSELWVRVNDEYDEKIAANEPDMTLELNEADFDDSCTAEASYEEFIKGMSSLTEKEKAALLADLAEIEMYENRINEIYSRMTDENAERLYAEIDAVNEKLTAVLERNAALWERVNDEYDEKIAANEPDMTLELNEADFDDVCPAEESYAESIKSMRSLTEKEKAALLADLAEIESLEAQIDELYYRMTDENADRLYGETDALYEKLDAVLDRNAELWDRVDAEYDEKIAAIEPDMPFELEEDDLAVCEKGR